MLYGKFNSYRCTLIILLCLSFNALAKKSIVELNEGDIPPHYLGKTSKGEKIDLNNLKGKVVIISFWASWCKPCLQELPVLDSIQKKLGDKIKIIAINYKQDRKLYRQIRHKLKDINLIMLSDPMGSLGKKFGVKSIPNMFLISKDGTIAYHGVGYGDKTLDKIIKILNQEL
jgi:thiol-disulfide isomerase/thioredoxin